MVALVLSMVVPGLGLAQSSSAVGLEGTPWVVRGVVVDGTLATMPVEGPVATMVLRDGRARGDGGCNVFASSYLLDGSAVTFGPVNATRRQCLVAAPAEDPLFRSLPLVASWSIVDDELTLLGADAAPLVELEHDARTHAGIRGLWSIRGLADRDGTVVDPTLLARAEATFGGGRFRATVGCNWITGSYVEDGSRLTITPEFRTMIGCPRLTGAEEVLADALPVIVSWSIAGDAVVLGDQAGEPRVWLGPRGAVVR
jgi:heat shock protein HslJ